MRLPHIRSIIVREFLAEFLGVVILCVIGNGSIAEQVLSRRDDLLSINLAYGFGVTFGVYVAFGVSGGHLNPAVTLSQAVIGKFPWYKVPIFFGAQYLGGFVSAIIVYYIYLDAIAHYDFGVRQVTGGNGTAGIFATYPKPYVGNTTAFFDQIVGTAILMIGVLSLTNNKNVSLRVKSLEPLLMGFLVAAIGMSYGANCGGPVILAVLILCFLRKIASGPRIWTAIIGYGREVFYAYHWYFWVPVVGPHVGAIVGTLIYKYLVGMHFAHDLELVEGAMGGDDEAARVGKGKANDFGTGDIDPGLLPASVVSPSPTHSDDVAAMNELSKLLRQVLSRQGMMAPDHIIGQQNVMWRQNAVARKMTYAPSTSQVLPRNFMRQNTAPNPGISGFNNANIGFVESKNSIMLPMPKALSPAADIQDKPLFSVITDSKRPAI